MTIREMELRTGLTRANIRFYESQGLISPTRLDNNYREYSDTDRQILLRVKLLRALGMSIDQIKALQSGSGDMTAALDQRIAQLEQERSRLERSGQVCAQMRTDRVQYDTLDAPHYLTMLEQPAAPQRPVPLPPPEDTPPRVFAPWQRYFARSLDTTLYGMILIPLLIWFGQGRIPEGNLITTVLTLGLMLLAEPLLLHFFGTTLGKWIFGIRVTDPDGRRLSIGDGFRRTLSVLIWGIGLDIPIFSLYRQYKSYRTYENDEYLPWDDCGELIVSDKRGWRWAAAVVTTLALLVSALFASFLLAMPDHRGDITPAQFCQNYRYTARQQELEDEEYTLLDDGTWAHTPASNTAYVHIAGNDPSPLTLHFTTENGIVTAVTVHEELTELPESSNYVSLRQQELLLLAVSFLHTQSDFSIFDDPSQELAAAMQEVESFRMTRCGLEFFYQVDYSGYLNTSFGALYGDEEAENAYYAMTFTISLAE